MQSTTINAEPRIGVATSIRPNAEGIVGGSSQTLSAGSELYANQTIRTGNLGVADLVFIDKTNLSVGPTSEVRLDKFIYDPNGSSGRVVIEATRGAFRFVTGTQDSKVYQIKSPYGSLGVRGTVVEVVITPKDALERRPNECATKIRLVSGTGATYRTDTGKTANLSQPDQIACITRAGDVTYSTGGSILSFDVSQGGPPPPIGAPPPGGTTTPPTPCVSPSSPSCP